MEIFLDFLLYLLIIGACTIYALYKYTKEVNIEKSERFEKEVLMLIEDVEKKQKTEQFIENWLNISKEI
ncbi:hypothetical protein [Peptoniphilus timonensis]|uniref:hypothetical protein n=1 Tax=Peptoniphilus timonensis TaxID=1268254 RepID=UPI00031BFC7D|nr:hypothetical protein [Peptoniphilus timonensis]